MPRRSLFSVRFTLAVIGIIGFSATLGTLDGATDAPPPSAATFRQYCYQCHGGKNSMGGINIEKLFAQGSVGEQFEHWRRIAGVLEEKRMPPKGMPPVPEDQRTRVVSWIDGEIASFVKRHEGDPGRVTVRRLTSGEYAYAIEDLTGLKPNTGIDSSSDSVGGEGFANFGDVQFMQDANLERYLEAAKRVANHAVIGAGPLEFFVDPGKTGFELSAIDRIRDIYEANGFRTVSGEGGRPYGLERYGKALFATWSYRHRAALGEPNITLKQLAAREGIPARFTEHIWDVVNRTDLGYPASEVAARWRALPVPADKQDTATARKRCTEIQEFSTTWASWLFARGDVAAGGAGDESPLEFSDRTLKASAPYRFQYFRGGRFLGSARFAPPTAGPVKVFVNVVGINPAAKGKAYLVWRNPTVGIRPYVAPKLNPEATAATAAPARRFQLPPGPREPLKAVLSAETVARLKFGETPDGAPIGPNDFATGESFFFEVPMPEGEFTFDLEVNVDLGQNRDQVFRVMISDREDGRITRGRPTWALIGDMKSEGYRTFRAGVTEYASILPPNSHGEPTPADKDPVPDPFDNTYNVPEHDEFIVQVKYIRDDDFVVRNLLDEPDRIRLDQAWNDLYASFEYFNNYLRLLAKKYDVDLKGDGIAAMTPTRISELPEPMRQFVPPLRDRYESVIRTQEAARPRHIEDSLDFASRAWRRPLADAEKRQLRAFYAKALEQEQDHVKAIRALIARILVAPQFLYRLEPVSANRPDQALNAWDLAGRLSFFLWASIPDEELRGLAAAGKLAEPEVLRAQAKRMLADPKARRFATEFFGQWLGFYRFDDFRGVDTTRFPEFTEEVKDSMHDEAVTFFEHVVRNDRPVSELLFADYTFLNQPLAKHYGIPVEVKSKDRPELVTNANVYQRGGFLRLGAVLTATSAPLRTSPVKRGDWLLRRVLGEFVPPPPADAGSIPADDKEFGGLTVKGRLDLHKRNATCAGCHLRIDPLGFPLENYDSVGRWRTSYSDGKSIENSTALADSTVIDGVDGLLRYLRDKDEQVRRTTASKLTGYALGRTIQASDLPLIEKMVAAGDQAGFSALVGEIVTSRQFRYRKETEGVTSGTERASLEKREQK